MKRQIPKYRKKQTTTKQRPVTVPAETLHTNTNVYVEPELPDGLRKDQIVDYLSEDDTIPSQKYACVSMLSLSKWRSDQQRSDAIKTICNREGFDLQSAEKIIDAWAEFEEPKRGFKIRGVYGSYQDARKRSEFLQRTHKNHNIGVCSVGYWVPFDPDPEKIGDQSYAERELNELKEGYEKNKEKGKEHFEEQKAQKAQRARVEGTKWGQEQLLKKKESRQEVEYRITAAQQDIDQYTDKIERAKLTMQNAKEKLEYMETHPEVVEEEAPSDDVPESVLKEAEERAKISDSNRERLGLIENERVNMTVAEAQAQHSARLLAAQQAQAAQAASQPVSPGQCPDELILPHQAREQIKKELSEQTPKII